MNRRAVLAGIAGVSVLGGFGWQKLSADKYRRAVADLRRPMDLAATGEARLGEILRYTSLAPNSHNTQAWSYRPTAQGLILRADPRRKTPIVDPDDHHLYVSLGAALETLIIAATAYGLTASPDIAPEGVITVTFTQDGEPAPLLPAIVLRQSHRGLYDGTPLSAMDRADLLRADPDLRLIDTPETLDALRRITVAAYGQQMADDAYRAELLSWLRFSADAALRSRDGLFAGCNGSPTLPQDLGRLIYPMAVTAKGQMAALQAQLDSAPTLALLVTDPDTTLGRIETGRRLQRISLTATQAGLCMAHVNPGLENPTSRAQIAQTLGIVAGRASILLRLGRSDAPIPYALRRIMEMSNAS